MKTNKSNSNGSKLDEIDNIGVPDSKAVQQAANPGKANTADKVKVSGLKNEISESGVKISRFSLDSIRSQGQKGKV